MRVGRLMRAGSVVGAAALVLAGSSAFGAFQRTKIPPASGAALDEFGNAVAISGTVAVVGAWKANEKGLDSGAAYVYTRLGSAWNQQAKLVAPDGAAGDAFGWSVAVSGDTVVIGAHLDDDKGLDSGSAYIFTRAASIWSLQKKLVAADGATLDHFGHSVAITGLTAVIGARDDDSATKTDSGSAYVFTRSGATWSQQSKLTASDAGAGDGFGHAVAIAGETVIVGAPADNIDPTPATDKGSAYVFTRSGTSWSQQKKLVATDALASDRFGNSVALASDTAIVGAKFDDNGTAVNQGSAYAFTRSGVDWTQQAKLVAADGAAGDLFGQSVAVVGDTAIIGAYEDKALDTNSGSVYVFTRTGMTWAQLTKVTPTPTQNKKGDKFGGAVAMTGDFAVIGAQFDDSTGAADMGAVYMYEYVGCTPTEVTLLVALGPDMARIIAELLCGIHVLPA
jgi:FG-GAP repeat protein